MVQPLNYLKESPSQTAGPYVHIGCTPNFAEIEGVYPQDLGHAMITGDVQGQRIRITGRVIDAAEAARIGLVHRTAPAGELSEAVREVAGRIADGAPLALRYLRLALRRATESAIDRERIAELAADCYESDDYREGIAAFLEKRRPRFLGR